MIPYRVEINGYRRFEKAEVLLDNKVVAFVGPNEAGKSSFFNALLSLENSDSYSKTELTKGLEFDSEHVVVSVEYLLDSSEKDSLKNFNGVGKPRFYTYEKSVEGKIFHKITGEVKRDIANRKEFNQVIQEIILSNRLKKSLDSIFWEDENGSTNSLYFQFNKLKNDTNWDIQTIDPEFFDIVEAIIEILDDSRDRIHNTDLKKVDKFIDCFNTFKKIESVDHPKAQFLKYLENKRPNFILFSDEERNLRGHYSVEDIIAKEPSSLANLLALADVSMKNVTEAMADEDGTKRLEILEKVNTNLQQEYSESWQQFIVYPKLMIEPDSLRIKIKFGEGFEYNDLQERSEGLKQFIAMKAFLAKRKSDIKPVLLIDEAEIHLHYSAQADLIKEFENQNYVNSIIYTTHSAGCLPSDLGSGIRIVEPKYNKREDIGRSVLKNSIWGNNINVGFSPLLLAMGANILAFTPARKALISEGVSDVILLPRIFREGLNIENLDFQIIPGIASIPPDKAKELELEAAMVAYIVDGDKAGDVLKKN